MYFIDLITGTFSKSLASVGGFIAGDARTMEFIKHQTRSFIFSASLPPASAASALAALKIIRREPQRIERLWANTRRMKQGLDDLGFNTGCSATPIIPVLIPDLVGLMNMCKELDQRGIFVNPIVPPAVLPDNSMLRVSLMATHPQSQIDHALETFASVGRKLQLIR